MAPSTTGFQNDTSLSPDPIPNYLQSFLNTARDFPDFPAVIIEDDSISYRAFSTKIWALAHAIRRQGPKPRVAIAVAPSADAYAAMFATGIAGGVYAPINLRAPLGRQKTILQRFKPDVVIAATGDWATLLGSATDTLFIDPEDELSLAAPADDAGLPFRLPAPESEQHRLAYIIFTSGSTGIPKGVEISKAALDHYVNWLSQALDIRPGDRLSQYANIAFDLSVMEIYGALCVGASLHPPSGLGDRLMPTRMIERENLTHWISVPSVVNLMIQSEELTTDAMRSVRRYIFCGEPLTPVHVNHLLSASPNAVVQNTYGPTEATVSMTSLIMTYADRSTLSGPTIALGAPINGMDVVLVGGPDDDEGELVLLGPQLAEGYLDDPQQTARSFREIAINGAIQRCYFTGDWARRTDGQLFFQNRTDFQIKHKGYRIELGDIQSALSQCGVSDSVVFVTDQHLVAYAEVPESSPLTAGAIRREIAQQLDSHALPDRIVTVSRLPRNENDKINRKAVIDHYHSGGTSFSSP